MRTWVLGITAACLMLASLPGQAQPRLEDRVTRLERLLNSRGLVEMLTQLEQLQREVQALRGEVELQGHALQQLKARQRDLYVDLDRRLQQLEAGAAAPAPAAPATGSPAMPSAPEQPAAPPATPSAAAADAARADYQRALDILREGRYRQAGETFRAFLKAHPDSAYADNAQYWLAETYYVTRQFDTALAEFEKVLKQYPGSSKTADARLKMGFIHYEKGNWDQARQALQQVVAEHPGTTAARLAAERLARMKREGH
ncbi:tol-pal system protein YbgF [Thiohalobacter sp.]|uniref:tol-pal system protein YbgF n=1 Tax=Thiohalobacter sp. TaxID=2025948 RepID=UPI0026254CB2|nr:tol-pal system protein YbgF [Thiohalobacter sp.]